MSVKSGEQAPKSPQEGLLRLNIPKTSYNCSLKDLNAKRSSVKGRITKYRNFINTFFECESITRSDYYVINQRFERFREMLAHFDELQSEIELSNQDNLENELDIREEIESDISLLIAQTQCFLEQHECKFKCNKSECDESESNCRNSCKQTCRNSCNQNNNSMGFKLPTIKIANFDGTYYKWLEFRDTFTSLIHNNDRIEPIHKFYYLNSYLEGEASRVISNLEVSSTNYKEAWGLLCERYNNEKQLINNHLHSLLNIQPVHRDSAKGLRFLIDHVSKNLRALNTLGEKTESWDSLVIYLVAAKLDNLTSVKWEEHKNSFSKSPSLNDFFQFLKGRSDVLESLHVNKPERHSNYKGESHSSSSFHKSEKSHIKSFAVSASTASTSVACVLCNGSHRLYDCASFLGKPVDERIAEVLRLKLCLNCLRKGHSARQCRLGPCSSCKGRHNSLLHKEHSQAVSTSESHAIIATTESEVEGLEADCDNVMSMSVTSNNNVLLSTALIDVYNPNTNQCLTIRALMDSGSQTSLITNKVKNALNLTPQPTGVDIVGVGNQPLSNSLQRCSLKLKSKQNDFETNISCLVLPNISGSLPNKTFDASLINLPSNIKLADPTFNQSAPVDMLIGADLFWTLIESDKLVLGPNQPIVLKSKLGWLLTGPFISNNKYLVNTVQCHHLVFNSSKEIISNESLNDELTKFWALEQIPGKNNQLTDEEIECENHFVKHTYRDENGRFHVRLPLVTEPDCLGNSFNLAKRQFLSLEKRFARDSNLKNMYLQFIQEYAELGHLSESSQLIPKQSYFIPHHAVLRPSSESTKLRVVFNGSAKTTSGYSLNDLQSAGPHIQDSLFNILLRFRQYSYVLSGDVEKMYRMVQVQDNDQDLQMILWRNHSTEPIKSLRLHTVTYGLTSSSFLSTRCLWQLGEDCSDYKIKQIIQNDFVVDDLLTGSDDKDDLLYIKQSVDNALAAGCFNLRKYRSNLPSILIDQENAQKDLIISSSSHTLGVGWDPKEDFIHFPTNYENKPKITKRSILSESCKVFDPLGMLSIFTIKPKILIQKLWIQKIDWDEPVPHEIGQSWLSFVNNMKHLHELRIPRHVLCKEPTRIELHCFCDASQTAYAACVYLKSTDKQGVVTVRLLCAKARVATVKPTTIPRLELCACLLGAQLADAVEHALRCVIVRKIYWSDSSIALAWLGTSYDKLKTFVANRVAMILDLIKNSEWRHVPTHLNPADLASRGVDFIKNNNLDIWWNGPTFLIQHESLWPSFNTNNINNIPELPEVKVHVNTINENETSKQSLLDFNRYSKLKFIQRVFTYLLRFIYNCRNVNNKKVGALQPDELSLSFRKLVYLSQADSFAKDIKVLRSKGVLNSKSQLISLNPFLDGENILRVGGRLTLSCYPFDTRHQMLLHAKHRLTKLLFQQEHLRLLHAGPQLLLYTIRDSVWPIAGRDLARTTARQCVRCRRVRGETPSPLMGSLPEQRVNPGYPFASAAVDFAGPYLITDRKGRGCKITKCYLCIFVCLRYKCVHLEAVSELSKDAFILALRRFISRRGKPIEFFSDNGRNFVAAAKEVGDFLTSSADDVREFSSGEGIKFNFQPAYSPHFGGLVEACVRSAKHHLKRILGQTHLTFEELATLFSQIEAILNSRPICPLSSSPDDLHPLTPGHFLIGRPLMSLPSQDLEKTGFNKTDRFLRLESFRQQFWKRWQLEYVTDLQQRHKWRVPSIPIQPGDLVLLKEENAPPMQWKLGRVVCLFPGKDGVARVAEVKTTTGTYRRGIKYLCPLLEPAAVPTLEAAASKAPEDVPAQH